MRLFGVDGLATAAWLALGFGSGTSKPVPARRVQAPPTGPQTSQWPESGRGEYEFTDDTAPAVLSTTPEWESPTNAAFSARGPKPEPGANRFKR